MKRPIEHKPRILIVDDRADGLITLEAVLQSPEVEIVPAQSGELALKAIQSQEFALIVMDVQMPGMDGFEVAERIHAREETRDIPVIFVTAINKDSRYIHLGYETGAIDYIFKPFDPFVLKAKVRILLDLFHKNRELERKTHLLEVSEQRNRLLLEKAKDIIVTTDREGYITSLNPAFESVTGWKCQDWLGKMLCYLVDPRDVDLLAKALSHAVSRGEARLVELRLKNAWDREITVELSCGVLSSDGEPSVISIVRDISARKKAEQERLRLERFERLNFELQQFAYICSHDLQEPLRTMTSFSQLLSLKCGDSLGAEGKEYLTYISQGAQKMSAMIRDLLEYARAGHTTNFQVLPTRALVNDALEGLTAAIRDGNADIALIGEWPEVRGSHSQLVRVFQNLITNALKFHGSDRVRIELSATQQGKECIFSVKDNGIGFDMKYADRIFTFFKRLHRAEEYPGNGIGLSVCKRIIEQHAGRIWAESQLGKGATFYFALPALAALENQVPGASRAKVPSRSEMSVSI